MVNVGLRDSTYVLDGLLYHESDLRIEEHYTDTAGFTDHVFGLMPFVGFRFAPRIRDLGGAASKNGNRTLRIPQRPQRLEFPPADLRTFTPEVIARQVDVLPPSGDRYCNSVLKVLLF